MKVKIFFLLILGMVALSCQKEEDEIPEPFVPVKEFGAVYYFSGTVSDTTTGTSVVGTRLLAFECGTSGSEDTIRAEGKYVIRWQSWEYKGDHCIPHQGFGLRLNRTPDSLGLFLYVEPDTVLPNDTVEIDLFF